MSDTLDLDQALKQWCAQAHALVGQPLVSDKGSAKEKWAELETIIAANVNESRLGPEGWKRQKQLIEAAIANREVTPADLSPAGDPIQKAIDLGTKIVKVRDIAKRGEAIGIKRAGLRTLATSATGEGDLAELEKIAQLWRQTKAAVDKYVSSGFKVLEDPVYQEAVRKAPAEKTFLDDMAIASVAGARSKADDYASWWPQARAALERVRKLKNDYTLPSGAVDPEQWYNLATLSLNIDRLTKEIGDELSKAENAVGSGRSGTSAAQIVSARNSLKRSLDAWSKVKVDSIFEKEEAGETAVAELTDLLIVAQDLAIVEPPLSSNPLYTTLTNDMNAQYSNFASQDDPWDRLDKRGVDCPATVSQFLRDHYRLGMGIKVGGRVYTVCASNTSTAGLAFHTPIPARLLIPQRPNVQSFVYHF